MIRKSREGRQSELSRHVKDLKARAFMRITLLQIRKATTTEREKGWQDRNEAVPEDESGGKCSLGGGIKKKPENRCDALEGSPASATDD